MISVNVYAGKMKCDLPKGGLNGLIPFLSKSSENYKNLRNRQPSRSRTERTNRTNHIQFGTNLALAPGGYL